MLLTAADTFRAAAADQLTIWAERAEVDIIKHQKELIRQLLFLTEFMQRKKRNADVLICTFSRKIAQS